METPFEISPTDSDRIVREFQIEIARSILKVRGADLQVLASLGIALTRMGRHHEALEVDRQIVELVPDNPVAWYNLACSYANVRQPDRAIESLAKAIRFGYSDLTYMAKDPDLQSLHSDERFLALIQKLRGGMRARRKRR